VSGFVPVGPARAGASRRVRPPCALALGSVAGDEESVALGEVESDADGDVEADVDTDADVDG